MPLNYLNINILSIKTKVYQNFSYIFFFYRKQMKLQNENLNYFRINLFFYNIQPDLKRYLKSRAEIGGGLVFSGVKFMKTFFRFSHQQKICLYSIFKIAFVNCFCQNSKVVSKSEKCCHL